MSTDPEYKGGPLPEPDGEFYSWRGQYRVQSKAGYSAETVRAYAAQEVAALQAENQRMRAALAESCDEHRAQLYEPGPGGGCVLLADAVAAERDRLALHFEAIAHRRDADDPHARTLLWVAGEIRKATP